MRTTSVIAMIVLGASLGLAAGVAPQESEPAAGPAEHYDVDPLHSSVIFRIAHLGVSNFYGRFNRVTGSYRVDHGSPEASSVEITVPTASIDSNDDERDRHLRSEFFFDAEEHPELTFRSSAARRTGESEFELTGELSLHGVTRSEIVTLKWIGAGDRGPRFGYRSGFETTFTFKRSDYGMDTYVKEGLVGDEVTVTVSIEGIRR